MDFVLLTFIILTIVIIFIIKSYNTIIRTENLVENAWADIRTYEQQRANELQSLMEQVVSAYEHEKDILIPVTQLRSKLNTAKDSNEMVSAVNEIERFVRDFNFEAYPNIESLKNLHYTQTRNADIEKGINAARRLYNANATHFNTVIKTFPHLVTNSLFVRKEPKVLFEGSSEASRPASMYEVQSRRNQ